VYRFVLLPSPAEILSNTDVATDVDKSSAVRSSAQDILNCRDGDARDTARSRDVSEGWMK